MRIAQIALVAAAVMSGFSATPNLATGFSTQSDFPTPASTVAATPARRIEVASVGGLFHLVLSDIAIRGAVGRLTSPALIAFHARRNNSKP
jgi:hypothetical protein